MTRVTVGQVDAREALAFWRAQRDPAIFVHPEILQPLCERVDWWLATAGVQPVCLWPICHAFGGGHRPPELASYVGPIWSDAVRNSKVHRWWTVTHESYVALLGSIVGRYGDVAFELPPGTRDVRVFQWFQRESDAPVNVDVACRHTALLRAPPALTEAAVTANFSRNRMRDIRGARDGAFAECARPDASNLYALYAALLDSKDQGDKARRREHEVAQLIDLVSRGYGRIIAYEDGQGDPAGFTLILDTPSTSLQVLIASSECARAGGLQALVQLQAIMQCFGRGATTFDFAGGNSRIGAEEKHRYGALPEMYFRVTLSVGAG